MSVDVPTMGQRVTYDWGVAVADAINDLQAELSPEATLRLASDESTNSATPSSISGFTIASGLMPSGRTAAITGRIHYSCSATNQGLGIGFQHGGGTADGIFRIFGVTAGNVEAIERLATNTALNDEMSAAATVSTGGGLFICEFTVFYTSDTATGFITLRKRRNGTSGSTGVTIYQGSYMQYVVVD